MTNTTRHDRTEREREGLLEEFRRAGAEFEEVSGPRGAPNVRIFIPDPWDRFGGAFELGLATVTFPGLAVKLSGEFRSRVRSLLGSGRDRLGDYEATIDSLKWEAVRFCLHGPDY